MAQQDANSNLEILENQIYPKLFKLFIITENSNRKFMISCNPNDKISIIKTYSNNLIPNHIN